MKTVNLVEEKLALEEALRLARKEPVLLLTPDGKEFLLSEADDFGREVETLRGSYAFQRFLDDRSKNQHRIPLAEIEREIEEELKESNRSGKD